MTNDSNEQPKLLIPKDEARNKIKIQIDQGEKLLTFQGSSITDLESLKEQKKLWSEYNATLLTQIFSSNSITEEYLQSRVVVFDMRPDLAQSFDLELDDIKHYLSNLKSIINRIDLFDEQFGHGNFPHRTNFSPDKANRIFIVHGHDESLKTSTARLIENLGYEAIILHEQPNKGRTIIEKFEEYSGVGFAVILLTPDDIGRSIVAGDSDLSPRARQNVILEMGFFLGKLGRNKVCALHKGNIELPTDYSGVLYTEVDEGGAWKIKLAHEMQAAGLNVDMDKIK